MQFLIKVFLLTSCLSQLTFAGQEIALSLLSLDEATKQVIEESKSKVLGAKTEKLDGKNVHVIKILTEDGRVQYLNVDPETGKIIQ